jgi:hypothetical protein
MTQNATEPLEFATPPLKTQEVHVCDLGGGMGRIVLRKKGRYKELRFEVSYSNDAENKPAWRPAGTMQEHRILMTFAKRQFL